MPIVIDQVINTSEAFRRAYGKGKINISCCYYYVLWTTDGGYTRQLQFCPHGE